MIRRYIIWRNNHAYDERLRRIVDRQTLPVMALARCASSSAEVTVHAATATGPARPWSLRAASRWRYGPAATVDDGQAQAERDRPTRPGGLVRGCRAALAAGQANNDRARAGRSSSPIQNDHSGHVANSRPTSR